ncbi:VanW family protein [Butyricicoccus faecihominis]|uniref:VanW family protein n=1 Tax=Butyricicoccus faecihominis TaxID=1712515 RepID=UPI0024784DBF|nr:VanW family protein [Butyricicoccus faecihominis]MCQ5130500.1 VanW family protein [Butyricicoccus faecihominis]
MFGSNDKQPKKGAHIVQKQDKAPKSAKGKSRAPLAAAIAGGVFALLVLLLCGFTYLYPNVFPGVTVGSIPVGGMNRTEALEEIEEKSEPLYKNAAVSVTIYEKTYDIPVTDVLEGIDAKGSAENAMAVGRTGNPFARMWQVVSAVFGQGEAQLAATVDEEGLQKTLADIGAEALTDPVEPTWDIGEDTMTIHAGKPGVKFDSAVVEKALAGKIRLMDFEPYAVDTTLTETPQIDLDKIGEAVIGEAVSATVDKKDGKTIVPEKPGVQFDMEEAKKIVGDGSAESYQIPIKKTPAKVTAADLKEKLFRDTLAQTSTYLDEGNTQRTNNVRLASKAINGTILNPGDEFSYNGVVGERTEARGYKPAHAYVNGQIVDEFGGGVCQPSSTLYMAVLRADLAVTERTNHSFTVAYTPLGEDATVDFGNLDFRFKNSTDYPIKILAQQTDGQMIMTLVGTKVSDKSVKTRTEVLATYAPSTVEKKDNSMTVGQTRLDQSGITGYSTRTYKVVTENGKTTEVLANNSSYQKRDKIVYVGTIQPTPPKTETPKTDTPDPEAPKSEGEGAESGGQAPAEGAGEGDGGEGAQPAA